MRLTKFLPARVQKMAPEAVKFAVVGGLNTVINFVVLNILIVTVLRNGELKANVIATGVAMVTSFMMNRHWTYKDRPKSAAHREFVLFVLFNIAGLAIELAILGATKYWLGLTSFLAINIAKFIGLVLGTIFRFFTYRTFVFTTGDVAAAHRHSTVEEDAFTQLTGQLEREFAEDSNRPRDERETANRPAPVK